MYERYATALSGAYPSGTDGVQQLTFRHPSGDTFPSDRSLFMSKKLPAACQGLQTLEVDVGRDDDLPGPKELAPMPDSISELTLNYPRADFPAVTFAGPPHDCIQSTNVDVPTAVTIGYPGISVLNRDEARAIHEALRKMELSRQSNDVEQ